MPKAVAVTYKAFCELENKLRKHGFREITRREVITIVMAHGLKALKVVLEGEIGFQYTENGYTVKVWTSCLRSRVAECRREDLFSDEEVVSRPTAEDAGWILIVDSRNKAQYFARPVIRTKNFVKKMIQRALITTMRIQKRPICEQCGRFMNIRRKSSRATYWECFQKKFHVHEKPVWKDWDFMLGPHGKAIVNLWRKEYQRYLERMAKKGKKPKQARFIRKPRYIATKDPYP